MKICSGGIWKGKRNHWLPVERSTRPLSHVFALLAALFLRLRRRFQLFTQLVMWTIELQKLESGPQTDLLGFIMIHQLVAELAYMANQLRRSNR